jgi:hypothetical protein
MRGQLRSVTKAAYLIPLSDHRSSADLVTPA